MLTTLFSSSYNGKDALVGGVPFSFLLINYLGGGDDERELVAVSAHELRVGLEDLGGLVETAVLGKALEEVLGQSVGLAGLVKEGLDTLGLLLARNGGVGKEVLDSNILGDDGLNLLQVTLNGIERVLTGSSGVQGRRVATVQGEQGKRGLLSDR